MPKTYKERLDELEIGGSIAITDNRQTWANHISMMHRDTAKQFAIRTNRDTKEMKVWRLEDTVKEA